VLRDQFLVVDVSSWDVIADETSGAEEKYWLREPDREQKWLFKAVRVRGDHVHGEDWAEKAVAHLAGLLGVPCARIELADMRRSRGLISADLCPRFYELQHGQILLEDRGAEGYEHRTGGRSHPGRSLENIRAALSDMDALPPDGYDLPFDGSAFDVFAGFLVLDAWVANTDRHDNNWAVLRPEKSSDGAPMRLCGSYDHASSLGFNVRDDQCRRLLENGESAIKTWCGRGYAHRFDLGPGRHTLVDLAVKGLFLASGAAREYWPRRLREVAEHEMRRVLDRIPGMSDPARRFATSVLDVNRRRVLDAVA
jgi:hypothetical protein